MRLRIKVDLKKIEDKTIVEPENTQAWQADIKVLGMMGDWKVTFKRQKLVDNIAILEPYEFYEPEHDSLFYELTCGVAKGRNYYDIFEKDEIRAIYEGISDFVKSNEIEKIKWFEFLVEQKIVITHCDNSKDKAEAERREREEYSDIPF